MTRSTGGLASTQPVSDRTPRSSWYVLFVLSFLYINSVLDRIIITMAIPSLKRDLALSDFQVSLLIGPAFVISYTLFSMPFGYLVDRMSRRNVVWLGVTVWSIFAGMCGLAKSFWMLFFARLGVGAGEAALSPAAYSIFADVFPRRRLTFAASVFAASASLGTGIAFGLGGWLLDFGKSIHHIEWPLVGQLYDWQFAFLVAGLPSVLFALLVYTFREPQRKGPVTRTGQGSPTSELWKFLKHRRTLFVPFFIGFCCASALANGVMTWTPTYFSREFELSLTHIGSIIGTIALCAGLFSHTTKGLVIDYFYSRGHLDVHLKMYVYCALVGAPSAVVMYFAPTLGWAIFGLVGTLLALISFIGYASAAIQLVTPAHLRGKMAALFILAVGGIGASTGPVVIAMFTDFVFGSESMLGYSLTLAVLLLASVGAVSLGRACKPFREAAQELENA